MPYVDDVTEPLIETLAHTSGLPKNQLAGHMANLDFWVSEVAHALEVIDGYPERFKRLKRGQSEYQQRHGEHFHHSSPPNVGIRDDELRDLRRRLMETVTRLLARCHKEDLISEIELDRVCRQVGLDVRDLTR
jgi:hypothetical protein